ncbi:fasciclin domain-containing protein, partial [Streptomyces flavidovirens]|uniref:fasciclin domain-containing protein n=1 Tax=Streptomyces flavidovirens TaxID=67298 RepID=UPI00342CF853
MNTLRIRRVAVAVAAAAALPLGLTACSDDPATSTSDAAPTTAPEEGQSQASDDIAAMGKPFGSACASVPKEGAGSFEGMGKDPVATAASNNPALSTLVSAVKKAGLVDTLNSAQDITVFAPTNGAFAKIPKADLDKVLNDKATLTKILTYHVVGQ